MTWGIPVVRFEQVYTAELAGNFTLPGFKAEIGVGQLEIDLLRKKGDMVRSNLPINIEVSQRYSHSRMSH